MNAREFLALAEQLAAFQAITSGALKQETIEAQKALADLGTAKELKALASLVESEKASLEQYKTKVEQDLAALKQELVAQEASLNVREGAYNASVASLATLEQESAKAVEAARLAEVKAEKTLANLDAKQAKALAEIEAERTVLQVEVDAVAAREAEVQRKLDLLKSIS